MINLVFYKELQKRKDILLYRVSQLEKIISDSPPGILRKSTERGYKRFYQCEINTDEKGQYITDKQLIIRLYNKSNAIKALKYTMKEIKAIDSIIAFEADNRILKLFNNIQIGKRFYKSDNFIDQMKTEYINQWTSAKYSSKGFSCLSPELYSMSGIRVRSKSEGKILDCLEQRNIPFLYEFPVTIGDITYHPDVKCLNPRTLEEIYWEHWGSMDDPNYVNEQLKKLEEYKKAGIIKKQWV